MISVGRLPSDFGVPGSGVTVLAGESVKAARGLVNSAVTSLVSDQFVSIVDIGLSRWERHKRKPAGDSQGMTEEVGPF